MRRGLGGFEGAGENCVPGEIAERHKREDTAFDTKTIAASSGVVRCRNPIEDGSRNAREYIICDLVLRSAFTRYRRYAMANNVVDTKRAHRELIVNEHIEAESIRHDVTATVKTFKHPRYEVPALGVVADGAEAVNGLLGAALLLFRTST
jgi:hypothetical protein